ncbi:MAG: PAC2 family protein [Candidatus Micrarchaeota archaeon]|nr:PAC2 family protein [Candidatus Micrarchaeota archaeon]
MKGTEIVLRKKLGKLRNPLLIVGLPGVGFIGRVVAKYMIDKLKGERFADIYSSHFPPHAIMTRKGILRLIKNSLYLIKGKKRDVIILYGETQSVTTEGSYEFSARVLELCRHLKVTEIMTIGGYATGKLIKEPRIFGAANSKKYLNMLKQKKVVFGKSFGAIAGMAGLLPAMAKAEKIRSVCLMGETHGGFVDAVASSRILEFLELYLDVKIDMAEIDKAVKINEAVIKKVEEEIKKQVSETVSKPSYIR